ncbi:hypothetical protein L7F22_002901 [Adiantum nelumboides]|nr:hypothetical protein [Adiantum nelumboides]
MNGCKSFLTGELRKRKHWEPLSNSLKCYCQIALSSTEKKSRRGTESWHVPLTATSEQAAVVNRRIQEKQPLKKDIKLESMASSGPLGILNEAYLRCGEVCEEYANIAKTFYLGKRNFNQRNTSLISIAHATVWCRRTDELVDGPDAPHITPSVLDRWEQRVAAMESVMICLTLH